MQFAEKKNIFFQSLFAGRLGLYLLLVFSRGLGFSKPFGLGYPFNMVTIKYYPGAQKLNISLPDLKLRVNQQAGLVPS